MKRTKKYIAGLARLHELNGKSRGRPKRYENEALYQLLESQKQIWDHKQGLWAEGTKSMFGDDSPSGVIRLRVMAHPQDVNQAVNTIAQQNNLKIIEQSDLYPNRRGSGVRVYLTCVLGGQS